MRRSNTPYETPRRAERAGTERIWQLSQLMGSQELVPSIVDYTLATTA